MLKTKRLLTLPLILASLMLASFFIACGGGDTVTATSITITRPNAIMAIGQTQTLTATVAPTNAAQDVTWSSSAAGTATVNATSGLVTAMDAGQVTITATHATGVTATATITVNADELPDDSKPLDNAMWQDLKLRTDLSAIVTGYSKLYTMAAPAGENGEVVYAFMAMYPDNTYIAESHFFTTERAVAVMIEKGTSTATQITTTQMTLHTIAEDDTVTSEPTAQLPPAYDYEVNNGVLSLNDAVLFEVNGTFAAGTTKFLNYDDTLEVDIDYADFVSDFEGVQVSVLARATDIPSKAVATININATQKVMLVFWGSDFSDKLPTGTTVAPAWDSTAGTRTFTLTNTWGAGQVTLQFGPQED